MRCDGLDPRGNHLRCTGDSTTRHHNATRRVGAGGERRDGSVTQCDADISKRHAGHLMRNLRQRGFQALTDAVNAGLDLQRAIRRELDMRLIVSRNQRQAPGREYLGPVRRLFCVGGEADTQAAPLLIARRTLTESIKTNHLAHARERSWVVAAVVVLVGDIYIGHRTARHEVHGADLYLLASATAGTTSPPAP